MANHPIVDVLNTKFAGRISKGEHSAESGAACILEVVSAARGVAFGDDPERVGMPDIRAINDAYADDNRRSLAMVRLGVALWDYAEWPGARRVAWVRAVALATVREVLPPVLRACGVDATACERAQDLDVAYAAAYAATRAAYAAYAAYAAAEAAARGALAAEAAAEAAAYAAYAAAEAAAEAAARAATRAAYAAYAAYAARAARAALAAGDDTLDRAVNMWIRCVEETANVA